MKGEADLAASVAARLFNRAKESGDEHQLLALESSENRELLAGREPHVSLHRTDTGRRSLDEAASQQLRHIPVEDPGRAARVDRCDLSAEARQLVDRHESTLPAQRKDELPLARLRSPGVDAETPVDEVAPCDFPLLPANHLDLRAELIDRPLHGILYAEPLEQIPTVFGRRAEVAAHGERMAPDLSSNDAFFDLEALEHLAVEGTDSVGCERNDAVVRRPRELVATAMSQEARW